jgi:hypothetical protein
MPSKYFCYSCAIRLGHVVPLSTAAPNLTGSAYQLVKYIKHTMPVNYQGLLSVFDNPEYRSYQQYTVNTALSGCCEIDTVGRTNLIWYAGEHVGMTFQDGKYYCQNDAIKAVCHNNQFLIHSFPANWDRHYINRCLECGCSILY